MPNEGEAVPPDGTSFVNDLRLHVRQGDQASLNLVNWLIRESKMNGTVARLIEMYGLTRLDVARWRAQMSDAGKFRVPKGMSTPHSPTTRRRPGWDS